MLIFIKHSVPSKACPLTSAQRRLNKNKPLGILTIGIALSRTGYSAVLTHKAQPRLVGLLLC